MFDLYKTGIGIAAGVAGTLFIGYCLYLNNKRRKCSEYKMKCLEQSNHNCCEKTNIIENYYLTNLNNEENTENYFLQELQLGEAYIARGHFESCVEHLANAIAVCGQPGSLLQVLYSTMPAQVFAMLIMKMEELGVHGQETAVHFIRSEDDMDYEIDEASTTNVVNIDLID